jgi:ABC-2 type transport system permease protein
MGEKGTLAVDRVSLDVAQGEVFGLVGPNGAGKTTLVKMLTTLILPTSGTARVGGFPLGGEHERRIKASIGLVTGNERSFYPRLSCRENLRFYAGLHDLSPAQADRRIAELSDLLELDDFLEKRYDVCSTGMKHRLALARSLINSPRLLFLDEPTRSLDPLAAARFRQAVYALAQRESCTVFLVTHDLYEAADLCDRVGVMLRGQLRVVDAPRHLPRLLRPHQACSLQIRGFGPQLRDALANLDDVQEVTAQATSGHLTSVELRLQDRQRALPAVMRVVAEGDGSVEELTFEAASWDEAFQSLDDVHTGRASGPEDNAARAAAPSDDGDGVSIPDGGHTGRTLRQALYRPLLFFRRDLRTQMRYRLSFLLQVLGILFSSASFYFVSQLLGGAAAPQLARYGGDYFSFVLIGIAFVGYQGVALHTFSGVIRSAQSMGTIEAMLVTPTRLATILFSSSLWSFAFTSVRVVIYLLLGAVVFGAELGQANVLAGAVILVLTVLTLSSLGILSASFIMVFKRGSPINFLIGSLSSLLGGVYYPVAVLPGWLQRLAHLFPLTYSLEAMRRAMLTGEGLVELAQPVAALAGFSVALLPLSLLAFHHAVRQAKRDGSLTHF